MKKYVTIIIILSLLLTLTACDRNRKPYYKAEDALSSGDFAAAKELLEKIPKEYECTELYLKTLEIVDAFEAGNWLECLQKDDYILKSLEYSEYAEDYLHTITKPFCEKINEISADKGTRFVSGDELDRSEMSTSQYSIEDSLPGVLYDEFLYLYYAEQYQAGKKLDELTDYPLPFKMFYDKPNVVGHGKINQQVEEWCDYRVNKLENTLNDTPGLALAYKNINAPESPVQIEGKGIYIITNESYIGPSYPIHANHYYEYLGLYPFAYADSPENISHVLYFIQSNELDHTYLGGGESYRATTVVTIKDMASGDVVFSKKYNISASSRTNQVVEHGGTEYTVGIEGRTYGGPLGGDKIESEIAPVLAEILAMP